MHATKAPLLLALASGAASCNAIPAYFDGFEVLEVNYAADHLHSVGRVWAAGV